MSCYVEIELSLVYVCLFHPYSYCVAQLVAAVVSASDETEVLVVEIVVVVVECVQRHETLAVVVVYLAIDAERLYAADVCIEFLADEVGHKFHHLIFYRLSFGVLCYLLHVRRVLALVFVVVLVG